MKIRKRNFRKIISVVLLLCFFSDFQIVADTKVVKGILVKQNQKVIQGIPVSKQETSPVVRGILVSPPPQTYDSNTYYYGGAYYEDDSDAILGFGVALGVTALILGITCGDYGHYHHHYHGHHRFRHHY